MKIIYVLAQKTKDYFKPIAAFATEEQTKKWIENNILNKERCDFVIQPLGFNPTETGFVDKEDAITVEQMKEVEQYPAKEYGVELGK